MGAMPPETLLALAELDPEAPIVGLLSALGEALPRLYPADLEGYGTSTRERIAPRSGHALRVLFDRVGALFGSPPYELFVHRVRGRGVAIELAEPTYVLVPAWLSELSEAGQTFLAVRVISLAQAKLSVLDKLTPRELEVHHQHVADPRDLVLGRGRQLRPQRACGREVQVERTLRALDGASPASVPTTVVVVRAPDVLLHHLGARALRDVGGLRRVTAELGEAG
jgi:hypothetical protein